MEIVAGLEAFRAGCDLVRIIIAALGPARREAPKDLIPVYRPVPALQPLAWGDTLLGHRPLEFRYP
jgi:hypothetical protein